MDQQENTQHPELAPHKICYAYDPQTGEFKGQALAFLSPLEGLYPLPANAVWEHPPAGLEPGHAWVMGQHFQWEQVQDNRNRQFYLGDTVGTVTELGPLPEGASFTPPQPPEPTPEEIATLQRNGMLAQSDVAVLRFFELGKPVPEALVKYRQELRDITLDPQWPDVTFPTFPTLDYDQP